MLETLVDKNGNKELVDENGNKYWWFNEELHREDGPAIEWADGTKEWWIDGTRHREDGPAVEWADGTKEWWLNYILYSKEDWLQMLVGDLKIKALFNEDFIKG